MEELECSPKKVENLKINPIIFFVESKPYWEWYKVLQNNFVPVNENQKIFTDVSHNLGFSQESVCLTCGFFLHLANAKKWDCGWVELLLKEKETKTERERNRNRKKRFMKT